MKTLLECIKDQDPDKVSVGLASSLDAVAQLELLQVTILFPSQFFSFSVCSILLNFILFLSFWFAYFVVFSEFLLDLPYIFWVNHPLRGV